MRRKLGDPFGTGRLMCAYCVSDYLDWERDSAGESPPPVVKAAVTVLPATVGGQAGGAAICLTHLKPLLRTRRLNRAPHSAEAPPATPGGQRETPVPRITPQVARG